MSDFNIHTIFNSPFTVGLVAIVLGLVYAVIALLANTWRHNRESERLAILKQQMIDKGMNADDIIRVIQAGKDKSS